MKGGCLSSDGIQAAYQVSPDGRGIGQSVCRRQVRLRITKIGMFTSRSGQWVGGGGPLEVWRVVRERGKSLAVERNESAWLVKKKTRQGPGNTL